MENDKTPQEANESVTVKKSELDALIAQNTQLKKDVGFCISMFFGTIERVKSKVTDDGGSINILKVTANIGTISKEIAPLFSGETQTGKEFQDFQARYADDIEKAKFAHERG